MWQVSNKFVESKLDFEISAQLVKKLLLTEEKAKSSVPPTQKPVFSLNILTDT